MSLVDTSERFFCFGARAAVHVAFDERDGGPMAFTVRRQPHEGGQSALVIRRGSPSRERAEHAASRARASLSDLSSSLTRFDSDSELCALNADKRSVVPVSSLVARFVSSAIWAAHRSRGLVDAALLDELELDGYTASMSPSPRRYVRPRCPGARAPARPRPVSPWRSIQCDIRSGTVSRPRGTRFDSGGLAKGMGADIVAEQLRDHPAFAVNCAGDIRIGGTAGVVRRVAVEDPFDGSVLTELEVRSGAVATSGTLRRCWSSAAGELAHHLIDPASGRSAHTGVIQVTALAATALEAEVRAKSALLAGPRAASMWLPDGGVIVLENGAVTTLTGGGRQP